MTTAFVFITMMTVAHPVDVLLLTVNHLQLVLCGNERQFRGRELDKT